jgi:hypothetical protein
MFNFRMRGPLRNRDTDEVRFGRLTGMLDLMSTEIATERSGLAKRYRAAVAHAAFLMESGETGEEDAGRKVTELTATIRAFELRMASLASQTTFVGQLHTAVDDFRATASESATQLSLEGTFQHRAGSGTGR